MNSYEFEITIQRKYGDNSWPVVISVKNPDGLNTHTVGTLQISEEDWRKLIEAQDNEKEYGTLLGKQLFREGVLETFIRNLSKSSQDCLLRIMLSNETDDDDNLRKLHWERLCAPIDADGTWNLLARDQRVPYSQYIPTIIDRRFSPIGRRDLRALVLVASPSNLGKYQLDPFNIELVVNSVRKALGEIPCDVLANIEGAIGPPTLEELSKQLTNAQKPYTLLHFVCHGMLSKDGETSLFWATEDNQLNRVTGKQLLEELSYIGGQRGLPHFTFLCTCESADPRAEGALGGLAQRLVRNLGMPAVVAMTRKVSVETALALEQQFYKRLRESGAVDLALQEATAGLGNRPDITVPALFSRLGGNPLFSDRLEGRELTDAEIDHGIEELRQLLIERAPNAEVLKQNFKKQVQTLQNTLGSEVPAARQLRKQALEELNVLCTQVLEIGFAPLAAQDKRAPSYNAECPFPGLSSFREQKYHKFFFGRDNLVIELQSKLEEHNFLAVLGPSGSGKSSVVLAGLIPQLQKQKPKLQMAYMKPGTKPDEQLKAGLSGLSDPSVSILVVDQFEELFTLCDDKNKRQKFITQLLALSQNQKVIITMRSGFMGDCTDYPELSRLMDEGRQKSIGPMNVAELGQAIKKQADKANLQFEVGLSNAILAEVEAEAGAMPLLQFALQELWKRRRGRWLCFEEYEAIGGIRKAIAQTADQVYASLPKDEQNQFKNIFVRLTNLNDATEEDTTVEDRKYTRRRVELEELVPAGGDLEATRKLVKDLADEGARLVITSSNKVTQKEEVEVAHEALIKYWNKLKGWLHSDEINLKDREDIRRDAQRWDKNERKNAYLTHRDELLQRAEDLRKQPGFLNQREDDYVKACVDLQEQARKQELKKAKQIAWVATIAGLVMLILALAAFIFWIMAYRQKNSAELKEMSTKSELLVSQGNQFDALITSLEAARKLDQIPFQSLLIDSDTRYIITFSLQQVMGEVKEFNRLEGHNSSIKNVMFSPPYGQIIASASQDKTVKLWNRNGEYLTTIAGHKDVVNGISFRNDGKRIASASGDGTVKLWTEKGDPLRTFSPQTLAKFSSINFSSNGEIVTASYDGKIIIWNQQGKIQKSWVGQESCEDGCINSITFNSQGNLIASAGSDGKIKLWDAAGILQNKWTYKNPIKNVSFSRDGVLIAGADDGELILWNQRSQPKLWKAHSSSVNGVSFSPNGQTIASAGSDKTIKLWDRTGKFLMTLQGHTDSVNSVSFSPDGQTIASASQDNTIKLWHIHSKGIKRFDIPGEGEISNTAIISPDEKSLASISKDNREIHVWDVQGKKEKVKTFSKPNFKMTRIGWSPDGKWIASIGEEDARDNSGNNISHIIINLWDQNGQIQKSFQFEDNQKWDVWNVKSLRFSPDRKWIAFGCDDGTVQRWDLAGNTIKQPIHTSKEVVRDVVFSPDGQVIASASDDFTIKIWSLNGQLLHAFEQKHTDQINSIIFSQDGQTIASASNDGTIQLWDRKGAWRAELKGHNGKVSSVSFSPDGNLIASAGADKIVRLWNGHGTMLGTLRGHSEDIVGIHFNVSGTVLVSTDQNNSAIFWNLNLKDLEQQSCDWLHDYFTYNHNSAKNGKELCPWVRQASVDKHQGTSSDAPLNTEERQELARLRRQVKQLEMERDVLKKDAVRFKSGRF